MTTSIVEVRRSTSTHAAVEGSEVGAGVLGADGLATSRAVTGWSRRLIATMAGAAHCWPLASPPGWPPGPPTPLEGPADGVGVDLPPPSVPDVSPDPPPGPPVPLGLGLADPLGGSLGWRLRTGDGDGARDLVGEGAGGGDALGPGPAEGLVRGVADEPMAGDSDPVGPGPRPEATGVAAPLSVARGDPGAGALASCVGGLGAAVTDSDGAGDGCCSAGRTGSKPYLITTGIDATITSEVMTATNAIDRPSRTRRLMRAPAAPWLWRHARRCRAYR